MPCPCEKPRVRHLECRMYCIIRTLSSLSISASTKLINRLTPEMEGMIQQVAAAEPPPRAKSMADVKQSCQHWTIRVLIKLADVLWVEEPDQKVMLCSGLIIHNKPVDTGPGVPRSHITESGTFSFGCIYSGRMF